MPREVSDLEINNNIRRIMTKRRIDTNKCTYRTTRGTVTIGGDLNFIGMIKQPEEIVHEIQFLEDMIKNLQGVRDVKIDFDGYEKNDDGDWMYKGSAKDKQAPKKKKTEEEIIRDKIKEKIMNKLDENYNGLSSDKESSSVVVDDTITRAPREVIEEFVNSIKSLVIKCGDCETEFNYCPKCGSKIKITFVTDEEEWTYDGKNISSKKPSSSFSTVSSSPQAQPKVDLQDLIAETEGGETEGSPVKKEEKKEEKKELTLAERAKMLLEKSKEESLMKRRKRQQKSKSDFNFDDL
jgi:hypothetical protein